MIMEPKPETTPVFEAERVFIDFKRGDLFYCAERYDSADDPPEGGECFSYRLTVGRSMTGARSEQESATIAPCWASAKLTVDELIEWLLIQADDAGIQPSDDEDTEEVPPCPKCKSTETFDTGIEKIAGEVAQAECASCGHEYLINIATPSTFAGIYDAFLPLASRNGGRSS